MTFGDVWRRTIILRYHIFKIPLYTLLIHPNPYPVATSDTGKLGLVISGGNRLETTVDGLYISWNSGMPELSKPDCKWNCNHLAISVAVEMIAPDASALLTWLK